MAIHLSAEVSAYNHGVPGGQWKWWVAQYSGINCRLKSNVSKEHWKMSEHGLRTLKAPPHRSNSSLAIAHP